MIWKVRESGLGATARVPGEPHDLAGLGGLGRAARASSATTCATCASCSTSYGYDRRILRPLRPGLHPQRIDFDLDTRRGHREVTAPSSRRPPTWCVALRRLALRRARRRPGARASCCRRCSAPELVQAFREFKAIWDPDGKMNPGKVVDPVPHRREPAPRHRLSTRRSRRRTSSSRTTTAASRTATLRCVGVGECRRDGRRHDVPELHGHARGEALDARPGAPALRDAAGRGRSSDGWRERGGARRRSTSAWPARAARATARSTSTWPPTRPSSSRTTTQGRLRPRARLRDGPDLLVGAPRGSRAAAGQPRHADAGAARARQGARRHRAASATMPGLRAADVQALVPARARRATPDGAARDPLARHVQQPLPSRDGAWRRSRCWRRPAFRSIVPRSALCCGRPLYDFGMLDHGQAAAARRSSTRCAPRSTRACPIVGLEPSCVVGLPRRAAQPFPDDEDAQAAAASRRSC